MVQCNMGSWREFLGRIIVELMGGKKGDKEGYRIFFTCMRFFHRYIIVCYRMHSSQLLTTCANTYIVYIRSTSWSTRMNITEPTPKKPPGPKPGTKGKAPSLESETGKLFLATFLLPESSYPLRLPNMPRGKAINLSVGLNRINKEYWKLDDPSVPKWVANLSAKAKAVGGSAETAAARAACRAGEPVPVGGDWYVEISESYLRTGNPSPARKESVEWMKGLLAQVETATAEVRAKQEREEGERAERQRLVKLEIERVLYEQWLETGVDDTSSPTQPVTEQAEGESYKVDQHEAYLKKYLEE